MGENKFLFVVGQLSQGGLERQLYYICKQLLAENCKVFVVCWNCDTSQFTYLQFKAMLGDQLIGYEVNQDRLKKMRSLRDLIVLGQFTHAISFSAFTNFLTYWCAFGTKSKVYGSLRTSFLFYLKQQRFKAFLNLIFPRNIIVNSFSAIEEGKQSMISRWRTNFSLLQNVIDIEEVKKRAQAFEILNDSNYFHTISIGNIRGAKRLDRLVCLFNFFKINHPNILIKHIHIGGGDVTWLNDLIEANQLEDYIILKGQQDNVYPYIKAADALLHFSDIEGASNVIMEGMCLGKPILSTNCGDTSHYIKDGHNGFVFDSFDERKIAENIISLIIDQDLKELISSNNLSEIKFYDINKSLYFFEKAI